MKTSDVLRKAGDALRERGWCQGEMSNGRRFCAYGAIRYIARGDYHVQPLRDVVCGGLANVDIWNDHSQRTAAEVMHALDAAYVLALQSEGVEPEDVL